MGATEVHSQMISVLQHWEGMILNPRFIRQRGVITWSDAKDLQLPDRLTASVFENLVLSGQYSMQLHDGSILRLLYCFDRDDIVQSASLGFYKYDLSERAVGLPTNDPTTEDYYIPWLRIDYDPLGFKGVLHAHAHLHVSAFPDARLALQGVPTPKQFLEAVMAWFYPDDYRERWLKPDGTYKDGNYLRSINEYALAGALFDPTCLGMMHCRIPHVDL